MSLDQMLIEKIKLHAKSDDIAEMKYYFAQLTYNLTRRNCADYTEEDAKYLRKFLIKYKDDNFYLTYDENTSVDKNFRVTFVGMNYKLHTYDEIMKIIPTGVDLNKICFSGDNFEFYQCEDIGKFWKCTNKIKNARPIKFIECPYGYNVKSENGIINYVEQLTQYHENLHIIHPKLIEAAKYFLV